MNRRRAVISVSIITLLIAFVGVFHMNGLAKDKVNYNMSPDISKKIVGSKSLDDMMSKEPIESLEQLVGYADLIVVGKVVSDGVTYEKEFPNTNGITPIDKDTGKPVKYSVTHSQIKIEKTLYGNSSTDTITLGQLGKAGNDSGETKVRNGDRMLLILKRHSDNESLYSSVSVEEGLFKIDDEENTFSLSDNITEAKYDGLKLSILEKDIQKAIKSKK